MFQNIRKFLTYVLVHNVAELIPYLAFALFRIPLPLTPVQALAVDMVVLEEGRKALARRKVAARQLLGPPGDGG